MIMQKIYDRLTHVVISSIFIIVINVLRESNYLGMRYYKFNIKKILPFVFKLFVYL